MKYRFEKFSSVSENFLLAVQEPEVVKIRDRPQKALNIRKQVKFDAFTFRQPSQFEQVIRNTASTDEIMSFEIERVVHRADPTPERRRRRNIFRTRKRKDRRDRKGRENRRNAESDQK